MGKGIVLLYGLTEHGHDIFIPTAITADDQSIAHSTGKKAFSDLFVVTQKVGFKILDTLIPKIAVYLRIDRKALIIKGCQGGIGALKMKRRQILAADICFWDELVDPVVAMISMAIESGTKQIIIADPQRAPFLSVCERVLEDFGGELLEWRAEGTRTAGALLVVDNA